MLARSSEMLDLFRRWHFQVIGQAKLGLKNHMSIKSQYCIWKVCALFLWEKGLELTFTLSHEAQFIVSDQSSTTNRLKKKMPDLLSVCKEQKIIRFFNSVGCVVWRYQLTKYLLSLLLLRCNFERAMVRCIVPKCWKIHGQLFLVQL